MPAPPAGSVELLTYHFDGLDERQLVTVAELLATDRP